jgi:peptidoglycan/LPS O-acetylase OafA/YrhL
MDNPRTVQKFQRPEIDGLRACAIVPVVLFHAGLGFPGGFVGVDIFFVISGFLIGGIILRELDGGTFSLARFWERRFRRIVPVLLVFFAVTLYAGWKILLPGALGSLGSQTIAALAGIANFKMLALTGGYWAPRSDSILLLHTWSLAVEEQFYLLLPIILLVSHRWFRQAMGVVLATLFFASLSLSFYWGENGYAGNFYLLPSRAWELFLGCLGAWAMHHRLAFPKSLRLAATMLGLFFVLFSTFAFHEDPHWPDIRTLLPTVGTLLILIAPTGEDRTLLPVKFLSLPPLRYIGLISYSLYLWHWPMIVFLKIYFPHGIPPSGRWGAVVTSMAMASISWRFIEQPFRNKLSSFRVPIRPLLIGGLGVWLCLLTESREAVIRSAEADSMVIPKFLQCPGFDSLDKFNDRNAGAVKINASNEVPRCVVLGTSHGAMLGPVIESLSDTYHVPCALFCKNGISPLFMGDTTSGRPPPKKARERRVREQTIKKYILEWRPDVVIIAARWNSEMIDWGRSPDLYSWSFPEAFSNTVKWLGEHSKRVVVLGQVPELPEESVPGADADLSRGLSMGLWRQFRKDGYVMPVFHESPAVTAGRKRALSIFRSCSTTNLTVIDPDPEFLNADHSIRYFSAEGLWYFDYNHLSPVGSMVLQPALAAIFKDIPSNVVHH